MKGRVQKLGKFTALIKEDLWRGINGKIKKGREEGNKSINFFLYAAHHFDTNKNK